MWPNPPRDYGYDIDRDFVVGGGSFEDVDGEESWGELFVRIEANRKAREQLNITESLRQVENDMQSAGRILQLEEKLEALQSEKEKPPVSIPSPKTRKMRLD